MKILKKPESMLPLLCMGLFFIFGLKSPSLRGGEAMSAVRLRRRAKSLHRQTPLRILLQARTMIVRLHRGDLPGILRFRELDRGLDFRRCFDLTILRHELCSEKALVLEQGGLRLP
jgi:hypothetical protein